MKKTGPRKLTRAELEALVENVRNIAARNWEYAMTKIQDYYAAVGERELLRAIAREALEELVKIRPKNKKHAARLRLIKHSNRELPSDAIRKELNQ